MQILKTTFARIRKARTLKTESSGKTFICNNLMPSTAFQRDIRHISIVKRRIKNKCPPPFQYLEYYYVHFVNTFDRMCCAAGESQIELHPLSFFSNHKSILAISIILWTFNLWCTMLAVSGTLCNRLNWVAGKVHIDLKFQKISEHRLLYVFCSGTTYTKIKSALRFASLEIFAVNSA